MNGGLKVPWAAWQGWGGVTRSGGGRGLGMAVKINAPRSNKRAFFTELLNA
jgi:hypothetical protein